jgi:hypothetical protein
MEKYVSWVHIEDAIERFIWFLQDISVKDISNTYHIVFGCGTVVRVLLNDKEFKGYDGSFMEEWPLERIKDDAATIDEIFSDCKTEWYIQSRILDEIDANASKAIRCAYETFIKDGFPLPGQSSARVCVPMELSDQTELLWGIIWEKRNYKVYNLIIGSDENIQQMTNTAGELRRLDFMFPSVYAVITPQMKVYMLQNHNVPFQSE